MKKISATIITFNEQENISRCIKSLQPLCDEILVLDSYSTDDTVKISKKLGATVRSQKFLGDGLQKKKSAELAKNDWILSIDADETLSDQAIIAIQCLNLENEKIAYAFRRKNFLGQKWLKSIYPDYKIRLYHRRFSHYTDRMIHSAVKAPKIKKIPVDIIHPTFKNYTEWITKLNFYSSKEAEHQIIVRGGKPVRYSTVLVHTLATFFKKFFLQGGIFKGKDGLMGSVTVSFHTFAKYIKIMEIQEKK